MRATHLATVTPAHPSVLTAAQPATIEDGIHFHMNGEAGPTMLVTMASPSLQEFSSMRNGDARFGLMVRGPVLFVLAKFGDLDWMDAPSLASSLLRSREPLFKYDELPQHLQRASAPRLP